ncbi:MAG: tetratricopeptide repeat protein [Halieaceae bacterium]
MTGFNPIAFYRELHRRRMIHVTLLYLAGAWGVVGGCDLLFPQFPQWVADPDVAVRYVFMATFAGFPLALVFGWLYDVTADGIQRTADHSETTSDPDTSLHRIDRGIIGSLWAATIGILATLFFQVITIPPSATPMAAARELPENSLGVLPFTVCPQAEIEPLLAHGIGNEVLRRLAELPGLKISARTAKFLQVTARASAFAFSGADFDPERIASTLRVRYLLTGAVCREGNTQTVSAELVDSDGYLLWTQEYSQREDAAGALPRTLAASLANGVGVRLGAALPETSETPVDRQAYEELLVGREYAFAGDEDRARAAFERALEHQPDYAEAVYELAWLVLPDSDDLDHASGLKQANQLAERALALAHQQLEQNPESPHSLFVAGDITQFLVYTENNLAWRGSTPAQSGVFDAGLAEAEKYLRASLDGNPSNTMAVYALAKAVEAQGRDEEALGILEQGRKRDPFNVRMTGRIAKRWVARGRYREAQELLDRFRDLPQMPPGIWWWKLELATLSGYWDEKLEILVEMLQTEPTTFELEGNMWQAWWFATQLRWLGLPAEADTWQRHLENLPLPRLMREIVEDTEDKDLELLASMTDEEVLAGHYEKGGVWVDILAEAGDYERAIRLMESIQHAPAAWAERDHWGQIQLAQLYAHVGRTEDATTLLEEIAGQYEAEIGRGIRHPDTLQELSAIYARLDRKDDALGTLELAIDYHSTFFAVAERDGTRESPDPWQDLRGDTRFQALSRRAQNELEQQTDRVRVMLAEHDLELLLAPLVAMAGG